MKQRKKVLLLLLIINTIIVLNIRIYAQNDFKNYGSIYEKEGYKIELFIKLNKNGCENINSKSYYKIYVKKGIKPIKYLNWKMNSINCDGNISTKIISVQLNKLPDGFNEFIDWEFDGNQIDSAFYDVRTSVNPDDTKDFITTRYVSISPDIVTGNLEIMSGDTSELTVVGGKLTGDAKWTWYEGSCDNLPIGYGQTLKVSPKITKTYFVRAEGLKHKTQCISAQVLVDDLSRPAKKVSGDEKVCDNDLHKRILKCEGGKLGKNAKWIWYQNEINEQNKIGEGQQIEVNTQKNTTYLVRAEGSVDTTESTSIKVSVLEKSRGPISINSKTYICYGDSTILIPNGGYLSADAKWIWSSQKTSDSFQELLGEGNSIIVSPKFNTEYFVRAEGFCNKTDDIKILITVGSKMSDPLMILQNKNPKNPKTINLEIVESIKSSGTKFVWYKGECGINKIGEGTTINLKARKQTQIYARAETECNNSKCISTTITPVKKSYENGFVNFGLVFGEKPEYSIGMITIGIKSFYVRAKMSANSLQTTTSQYLTTDRGIYNYPTNTDSYYTFNGNNNTKRTSYTIGYLLKGKNIHLYIGGGYGTFEQNWGIDIYNSVTNQIKTTSSAKNIDQEFKGPEAEAGLMLRFGAFNILGGASAIIQQNTNKQYIDAHFGIGFSF